MVIWKIVLRKYFVAVKILIMVTNSVDHLRIVCSFAHSNTCIISVSPNVSNQNGQQKRTELSATFIQKDESMFDGIIIQKDEFCRLHENESASKLNDFCNLLKDNVIQHCPICFKKNTCDQISGFITHLKGCAFKHKISTEQLIKAVQLLEKQTSERVALGLPKIASEKTSVKKNYTKKVRKLYFHFLCLGIIYARLRFSLRYLF